MLRRLAKAILDTKLELISGTGLVVRSSGEPSQLRYTNAERGKHDMGVVAPRRPSKGLVMSLSFRKAAMNLLP